MCLSSYLDPYYLAAYLESSDCRSWLQSWSSGSAIGHLSKHIIEQLPIPLPPIQTQQYVAKEYRVNGVDALVCLSQLLTDGKRDPITEWIKKELQTLPSDIDNISDPLDFTLLDQMANHVRPIRNQAAHGQHGESNLLAWLLAFYEAVSPFRGINNIPHGPGLLGILQESARGLKRSEALLKGNLPSERKARELTGNVAKWIDKGTAALANNVELVFNVENSILHVGEEEEIKLKVQNNSLLPIREVKISFDPEWGFGNFNYLTENTSETIRLQVMAPKTVGPLTLLAQWQALTLDGRRVDGKREIAFEVVPETTRGDAIVTDIGGSPYVCGDPIRPDRNDVFFGRKDLIEQIRRQIIESGNVVLLEGNRRAGKTSILKHLEGNKPIPGWLGVYSSLQGAGGSEGSTGVPTAAVFRELASSIAKAVMNLGIETPLPDGSILPVDRKLGIARACRNGISEDDPFADFREYIELVFEVPEIHNIGILLMLDEFDKLQEGIDNGVTSPQVPENIRFLVQTYPRFSAILTGSRRLKRLREEYWSALFGLGTRLGVSSLLKEDAQRLVTEPVKGRLRYTKEAIDLTISLTNRQPYLLQCLCNRIFDMAAQLKKPSVNLDIVDQAGAMLAENNEHFASLWDYIRSDRRRFIMGLVHKKSAGPDQLHLGVILELLSSYGIEVSDQALISDIEYLQELELIERIGNLSSGYYKLSIPLMGKWIDKQHDFDVLQTKACMETEDQNDG